MTRKRTIAQAVIAMPAAMADAALDTLTPDQLREVTPTQAANIVKICSTAASGIAFILEHRAARVIETASGARAEIDPESPGQQDQAQRDRIEKGRA